MQKRDMIVKVDNESSLYDLDGNDALLQAPEDVRDHVKKFAIATLPKLYVKALALVENGKNEKTVLEAMKFIKSLADGEVKGKQINAFAKVSDKDITDILSSSGDIQDD